MRESTYVALLRGINVGGKDKLPIYLCLSNGVARSRLTNAYFDAKLGTVTTMRNWRTVRELARMADGS